VNHRIFERKLRSRGLTPREHVRLSAASIYPFNKSHSTHTSPSCGGGGMGERALPPPLAVAWPQIVYNGDCAAPTHTDIYTYYRVRGSHVLLLSVCRSVGWLCACLWVWGCGCCPHTRYSGLCCCCCLATAAPLHQEAAVHMAAAGAQFNYAVFVRGRDLSYLWCVCVCVLRTHTHTHPRHHQLSPTPTHTCI
jgi:hypothetical protein